jgi:aspartate/glutamate racemase
MGLGAGAPRRPAADMIQQAFYTGWLRRHGIKHLTLDAPDRMLVESHMGDEIARLVD